MIPDVGRELALSEEEGNRGEFMVDSPSPRPFTSRDWLTWLALLAVIVVCYWPSLRGERLWDDPAHLTRVDLQDVEGLRRIWFELGATQQYYPVLHSAFWLQHQLWGDSTLGYHLMLCLQHGLAAGLLALVLRRLGVGRTQGFEGTFPWVAAALFALHPMAVESVAWMTEQKNTLSLCFALGAAWLYLGYVSNRRILTYVLATFLFLLALGSKSVTATLAPALLVVAWWRHGRLAWRKDVWPLVPWLVIGVGAGLFTAWVEKTFIGAQGEAFMLSAWERVLLASRNVAFYALQWTWPTDIAFFYPRWDVAAEAGGWWVYFAGALGVTVALVGWARRNRGPAALWFLYVGLLFPALGFVNVFPFQFSYVADHFHYHASPVAATVGACVWAAVAVRARGLAHTGLAAALLSGAFLSWRHSAHYVNDETLFRANIAVVPESWMAHHILAVTLSRDPTRTDEAVAHARLALRYNPQSPDAMMALAEGLARAKSGEEEAILWYERAIALRPHFVEARYNLGVLLGARPARLAEAIQQYEETLKLAPSMWQARMNLGFLLVRDPSRRKEAQSHFEELLRLRPHQAEAHHALANLYVSQGMRRKEAMAHYAAALAGRPDDAALRFDFAQALTLDPAQSAAAMKQFEEGLRIQPTNTDALNALGILYAQQGNLVTAEGLWREAQRLNPAHRPSRENLERLERLR